MTSDDDVLVQTSGRLHLGFLDLHGGLGRKFGSLGVSLAAPVTRLRLRREASTTVAGPESARAARYLESLAGAFGRPSRFDVRIEAAVPAHAGLGSGTQLALALGAAFCRLEGLPFDARAIAGLLARGARSGVGVGLFEQGGVVMDGGRGERDEPPPVISRLPFPEDWRILLIFDHGSEGLSGERERAAFRALPPFPEAEAARLCRLMVMQALPALVERDLDGFGAAVAELQRRIGDHFAPCQGGARFTSPRVARVLAELEEHGVKGVGQSSWGPTGFAFLGDEAEGRRRLAALSRGGAADGLDFLLTGGRNTGAVIAGDAGDGAAS